MKQEEKNYIDELFRDAFNDMEVSPNREVWNNIREDITNEDVDQLFRDALQDETALPSDRVWNNVQEHLPLNLRIKRSLRRLTRVAAVVVVGMLGIIAVTKSGDTDKQQVATQESPTKSTLQPIHIDYLNVRLQTATSSNVIPTLTYVQTKPSVEVNTVTKGQFNLASLYEAADDEQEWYAYDLATDNTMADAESGFILQVDEEKMKAILAPIVPLSFDSAMATINEVSVSEENGIMVPLAIENVVPKTEE